MTAFELQIIALILVAFIIGVAIGYVLRTRVFPVGADDAKGVTLESRQERPASALLRGGAASKSARNSPSSASKPQKPATEPAAKRPEKPTPASKTSAAPDNLQEIKGIGSVLEKKLNAMGIERFQQIANWSEKDIAEVDEQLNFRGRIQREQWVEQAQQLAKRQNS
jgi:predicted flap endonuclease-1-like 5' DNA nuclease